MSKHTPGPWFVPQSFGTQYVEARIDGGMLQEVAACGPTQEPTQQYANARLIAAAPALLEALCGLHDDVMDYIRLNNLGGENNHWLVVARAAIAAAKGEQ